MEWTFFLVFFFKITRVELLEDLTHQVRIIVLNSEPNNVGIVPALGYYDAASYDIQDVSSLEDTMLQTIFDSDHHNPKGSNKKALPWYLARMKLARAYI